MKTTAVVDGNVIRPLVCVASCINDETNSATLFAKSYYHASKGCVDVLTQSLEPQIKATSGKQKSS